MDTHIEPNEPYFLATYRGTRPVAPAWFATALGHTPERSRFISAGASIELLTWGTRGKPGLLFLHGNGAHADWWSHIAPFFADDWRCAALSWSGMGRSDRRPEGYALDDFAQEAKNAAHAAGLLDASVLPIIISHSLGGMVGMAASASGNDIFRGLVLIDTPIDLDPKQFETPQNRAPKSRTEHRAFRSLEDGLARFRLSPPQECRNDFIADYIARQSLIEHDGGWYWHFDPRRVRVEAGSSAKNIKHVRCPTAFFYGEQSAFLRAETLALTKAALAEGTPVIAIPEAEHHVMIDQPLALVSALRALLTRWPEQPRQGRKK